MPLRLLLNLAIASAVLVTTNRPVDGEDIGVQAPPGFEVALYADDDLAHDIYSLTIDSFGRVVVSGAGYVRILIDDDDDGVAETATQYVDGPLTGAQGMHFYGRDLICSGDAGLIRYRDRDGDDRADGDPDVFLRAKAGGEHDVHAIRQGPDGWWYVIAGNVAGITAKYITLPNSPVTEPQAGTVLRLQPDLSAGEVVADGFRNAYDFDFHPQGDLFTFDSDDERDISLPWYLPTRVFQVLPGMHAGWLSRSWKRPDQFLDMPPVIAAFGRGSPTGVVCYRHTQFPEKYRDALFVLDWTYGRVTALPLVRDGSIWQCAPEPFMAGVGQFGFAPTDIAVGPDGSLYISVGGRGTRGGVYRIRWTAADRRSTPADDLTKCLTAPQPLSSWSRREWEPLAAKLGAAAFQEAAANVGRSEAERVRAVEILTEKFGGLAPPAAAQLALSASALVRARAAWSLGRTAVDLPDSELLGGFLRDADPLVHRAALEALCRFPPPSTAPHAIAISRLLASPDRFVRKSAARVLARAEDKTFHEIADAAVRFGWQAAIPVAWAFSMRSEGFDPYSVDIGRRILESDQPVDTKCEAVRLIQIGLGDVGPTRGVDPVFDGYHPLVDLTEHTAALDPLRQTLMRLYPTGDAWLDQELGRLIAMVKADDAELFEKVIGGITPESDPVDDIHRLIIAARMPTDRTPEQRLHLADALVSLDSKIEARGLSRDANWEDRIVEMSIAHLEHDVELLKAVLTHPKLGAPGHVPFAVLAEDDQREAVIDRFVSRIKGESEYPWTNDVVFLLADSERAEIRQLVRSKFDDFAVRSAVLIALSEKPDPQDRALYILGLDTPDIGVLAKVTAALAALDADPGAAEQVALVRTLRRLEPSPPERQLQDAIVRLLTRNTGQTFDYEFERPPADRQTAAITRWSDWVAAEFPDEWAKQTGSSSEDLTNLQARLDAVDWSSGDAARGFALFRNRACAQCHGGRTALGPDLTGAAGRFSRLDLFTAIVMPHRDVSPRYQATLLVTSDGQVHTGLAIYESVDGLVLRTSTNQTLRIETADIEERRRLNTSLMPSGLLKDLRDGDLADLYAYLQTLGAQAVAGETGSRTKSE
ncbi:MAG: hypothetical protein AB7U20_10720 [Planctomycetaceae bacterium]